MAGRMLSASPAHWKRGASSPPAGRPKRFPEATVSPLRSRSLPAENAGPLDGHWLILSGRQGIIGTNLYEKKDNYIKDGYF